MGSSLYLVFLRRPRPHGDPRTDPFWEYGSFGLTGCHGKNLLHPQRSPIREGDRLAFVQGGDTGCRLLFITPPVSRKPHPGRLEIVWPAGPLPFRYGDHALLLADASGNPPEAFPRLASFLEKNAPNRPTFGGKLASSFRARTKPLDAALAGEMEGRFEEVRQRARPEDFIRTYADAVPRIDPAFVQKDRAAAYRRLSESLPRPGPEAALTR